MTVTPPDILPRDRSPSDPPGLQADDVLVVVPTLNEEHRIEACLLSLLQGLDESTARIVVMDGGSRDRTVEIVSRLGTLHPAVTIEHNPGRLQACAVNLAARTLEPGRSILLRADAHAAYSKEFVRLCVESLRATGAASVVVPMATVGIAGFQRAVAAAQNSLLGNGGAAHRSGGVSRFVDHGHHAAMQRSAFLAIGGYDESFSHNEDAEFDRRLRAAGGTIWLCREACITYFPRDSIGALARQYRAYGRGRCRTVIKHHDRLKLRQAAPLVITAALAVSVLGALVAPLLLVVAAALFALYGGWSIVAALRTRDTALLGLGLAALIMHVAWSWGFTVEAVRQRWSGRGAGRVAANGVASPR